MAGRALAWHADTSQPSPCSPSQTNDSKVQQPVCSMLAIHMSAFTLQTISVGCQTKGEGYTAWCSTLTPHYLLCMPMTHT